MTHGPGTIITPCQDLARYTWFQQSLVSLQTPPGSRWVPALGLSVVDNMNTALRMLRPEDEWAWFIGDDHTFQPDIVMRLLDRNLDVVAPLCAQRRPPWPLVHYTAPAAKPLGGGAVELDGFYSYLRYDEIPDDGEPFEVYRTGSAMLVRRHVLDAVGDPWFSTSHNYLNEDLDFCGKVHAAGYSIHVDPSVALGHIGHVIVTPMRREGAWGLDICHPGVAETHQFLEGGMSELANLGTLDAEEPALA